MLTPVHHHRTKLPPDLEAEAVALLRENTPEARQRAAQLLARGWAQDEEARRAAQPEPEWAEEDGGEEEGGADAGEE